MSSWREARYTMALFYRVSQEDVPLESLQPAADLAWFGQDTPGLWARLGNELELAQRPAEAASAYARSIQRGSVPEPWVANRLAWLILGQGSLERSGLAQAEQLAEYLVQRLGDSRPEGYQTLAEVRARQGRWNEAMEAARSAVAIARTQQDIARANHIAGRINHYRRQEVGDPEDARPASRALARPPVPAAGR